MGIAQSLAVVDDDYSGFVSCDGDDLADLAFDLRYVPVPLTLDQVGGRRQ